MKKILCMLLCAAMLMSGVVWVSATEPVAATSQIKNIIYMIPDGGAMASFFLADHVKQAGGLSNKYPNVTPVETGEMFIKDYLVGAETTHSNNSSVTDSAASGTALSSGYKTNNGMIGITPANKPRANILEACQELGKNTGIVVTYEWTNATPAAFSAHAENRSETLVIGEQVVNQGIDVVFGKTLTDYNGQEWFTDNSLASRGYDIITSKEQLNAIQAGDRVWGKLPQAYFDVQRGSTTPNLAELTATAIRALDDGNENGFFLMVEGSAVDGGGHNSNALSMVSEWLAFDAACKVAIEYAQKRTDTLVVILPDHDTGGLQYQNAYTAASLKSLVGNVQNGESLKTVLTWEGDGGHTGRNGGIFMYVPEGVAYPNGIDPSKKASVLSTFETDFRTCAVNRIDNTGMTQYLAGLLGVDMDAMTEKLFVDITDSGTYNANTEVFTFQTASGVEIEVERNTSVAKMDGTPVNLDGQVAVYLGGRFYIPQSLISSTPVPQKEFAIYADYNTKSVRVEGLTKNPSDAVTVLVTEPGKGIAESAEDETLVAINQTQSTPWCEYSLNFAVGEGKIGDYNYFTRIKEEGNIKEYKFSFKNMAVEKNGIPVTKMSDLAEGDTVKLVLNGYDAGFDGTAMIVQYGEGGALLYVTAIPVQGSAVKYEDEDFIEATIQKGVKSVKAYYWNKVNHVPFTGVYVIE